jgi:succinate-acetate transporter protein
LRHQKLRTAYRIAALRKNVTFIALFAFLTATFAVLAAANFTGKMKCVMVSLCKSVAYG